MTVRQQKQVYRQLGYNIREYRQSFGISQDQLAKAIGLTRTSICNIETGLQHTMPHIIVAIACVLDAPIRDLFHGCMVIEKSR